MARKTAAASLVARLQTAPPAEQVIDQLTLEEQGELFGPISPPSKPGRPRGAANLATREWARKIVASGASPLEFWARVINADPQEMAEEWGLKLPEVLGYKLEAAKLLAPYVHKKQPVAVDLGVDQRHVLVFGDLGELAGNDDGLGPVIDVNEKGEENQRLSISQSAKSDDKKSDESASD